MEDKELAVLRTLAYSDIFQFPLTAKEIYYYLDYATPLTQRDIDSSLKRLESIIVHKKGYYAFFDHAASIENRLAHMNSTQNKVEIAQSTVKILRYIPSVLYVGISGSVAAGSTKSDDDIDFFVITENNTLFITRFLLLLLLQFQGRRRKRNEVHVQNKVCLNMLIDEASIVIDKEKRSLYLAREIVQMVPLFDRSHTYLTYLEKNNWVYQYFSNSSPKKNIFSSPRSHFVPIVRLGDKLAQTLQTWLIKKHSTQKTVPSHVLAFYPADTENRVMKEFEKRVTYYIKCYSTRKNAISR